MPEYLNKYREIKGWIPPTDVDEIDVAKDYARDLENVDLENGYMTTTVVPTLIALPTAIQTLIDTGWELMVYKYFRHSEQGDIYVSILYKYVGTEHQLRFFVNSEEILIDEVSEDIVFEAKPSIISYDLVNDQLKINLNVNGIYSFNEVYPAITAILNLTVMYLSDRSYIDDTIYLRNAGWFIYPRWLSWTLENHLIEIIHFENGAEAVAITEFYAGEKDAGLDYIHFFTQKDEGVLTIAENGLKWEFENASETASYRRSSFLKDLKYVSTMKLSFKFYNMNQSPGKITIGLTDSSYGSDELTGESDHYYPENQESWVELYTEGFSGDSGEQHIDQEINAILGKYENIETDTFKLWIVVELGIKAATLKPSFVMWNFGVEAVGGCVLSVNEDKQRALIKGEEKEVEEPTILLSIFHDPWLRFPVCRTDWRITEFELYLFLGGSYILYGIAEVDGAWVTDIEFFWKKFEIYEDYPAVIDTMVFNYGLGASVRVDNQKQIYREVFYRGRVYFVKNDEKIYLSHLSGSGRPQPDSFPYNEDVAFGFLLTYSDEINKGLAITLLDEIVVLTEKKCYVYVIEGTGTTPFRRIKAINGGAGISNVNSLVTEYNGDSMTKVLLWFNDVGVYAYVGGREAPVSITDRTHRNYWRILQNKDSAVCIYNRVRDEYWIQVDGNIVIYEIATNTWKKYKFTQDIKDFVGIIDGLTYFISEDNKLYKIDPAGSERLEGIIEYYDNITGDNQTEGTEIQAKILQDIGVTIKNPDIKGTGIKIEIIVDDNTLEEVVYVPSSYRRWLSKSPYQVQYGRIRFRLTLPALDIGFRELSYLFTILPIYNTNIYGYTGIGQQVGGSHGVYW